jgi:hypothetical protein
LLALASRQRRSESTRRANETRRARSDEPGSPGAELARSSFLGRRARAGAARHARGGRRPPARARSSGWSRTPANSISTFVSVLAGAASRSATARPSDARPAHGGIATTCWPTRGSAVQSFSTRSRHCATSAPATASRGAPNDESVQAGPPKQGGGPPAKGGSRRYSVAFMVTPDGGWPLDDKDGFDRGLSPL